MKKFYLCKCVFTLLAVFFSTFLATEGFARQTPDTRISLKMENSELSAILQQVGEKSGLKVFYNADLVRGIRTRVDCDNQPVGRVLAGLLDPHGLRYVIENGTIVVSAKPRPNAAADQRQRTVSGTVRDSEGKPLVGAAVIISGTNSGTSSDAQGRFFLALPADARALQVSFLGMITRTVEIGSQSVLDIVLHEDENQLENVVITGYYTQSQTAYTGSARTYNAEQLMTAGNSNVLKSLSSLDPSFRMTENISAGSNPNVIPDFTIRGQTAINFQEEYETNPNQPLFIVDGFSVDAETVFDMDIYKVQSVTILKDASATAIYGSRAANGVVVITTVAPKAGKLSIRYNVDLSFEAADLSDYNLMNACEKLDLEVRTGMYSYFETYHTNNNNYLENTERAYAMLSRRQGYLLQGIDTYWLNKPLHSLATGHRHRINIEGGDPVFRYQVNGSYENNPGGMKESFRERKNIGMKLIYNYRNFRFSNEMSYNVIDARNSPYGSFRQYTLLNPYLRPEDDLGRPISLLEVDTRAPSTNYIYNPLYNATLHTRDDTRTAYFTNNFSVIWDVTEGLMITGNLSVRDYHSAYNLFKPAAHTDFALYSGNNFDRRGTYKKTNTANASYEGSLVASYQRSFDRHVLTARAGYNIQESKYDSSTVEAEGFPNENLDDIGFALQYLKDGSPSSSNYTTRMLGLLANLNYIYNERYMADFSFRYDAQSSFGADRKWAPFWSAGLGWNIHNENFLRNSDRINCLKIRGSVGETGSVDYDPSQALATYYYLTGTRYLYNQGAFLKSLGNPELGWQKTLGLNAGADLAFFDNRLNLTFDYYVKTTNDMITSISVAPSTGNTQYTANLGKVENKGFELYARAEVVKIPARQLTVALFGQLMRNKNTLKEISNSLRAYNEEVNAGLDGNAIADSDGNKYNKPRVNYIEGRSINGIYVNQSLGVDPATGREFFVNQKDGTYTTDWSSVNNIYAGSTDPKFYGSFGLSVYWKTLLFTANFGYSYGGYYYNQTLVDKVEDADLRYNVDRRVGSDRWTQPGDVARFTGVTAVAGQGPANTDRATRPTSRFVEKRSFLELQAITATYDIRGPWIEQSPIGSLRLNFSIEDLFHASTVKTERGITYPYSRNFSLGVQITF